MDELRLSSAKIELIARVAHEVNRAYCKAIGDDSQRFWEVAQEWQKDSARNGVRFRLLNPLCTSADMHANWMAQKVEEGWRWGDKKDVEKKLHPCMVPYDQLPLEQRVKDSLFSAVVDSMRFI